VILTDRRQAGKRKEQLSYTKNLVKDRKGTTLVETMVTLFLISILMAMAASALSSASRIFVRIQKTQYAQSVLDTTMTELLPLVSAVGVAAKTIGNGYVESQFDEVITMVRGGVPLSQGLREVDGLLKKLSSTILVGEESGRLDVMLDSIAETLEADAEQATKRMVTLLEPILIIFMALIVGCIMIGVMLPIYQSYSAIENA